MIVYLILIGIVCLYQLEIKRDDSYYTDYMGIEKSTAIKGIFILLVFSSHCITYFTYNSVLDIPLIKINKYIGQLMVTMFLFYSGFGVFECIKNRGKKYIDEIPVKRVLQTWLNFDLAIIIFWVVSIIRGKEYGIKKVLLSFVGWEGIGNSNWYIFCVVILYMFTYISFKTFKDSNFSAIMGITVLTVLFMCFMARYKDNYWYNTSLCYSLGMWYSYYRERIEKFIQQSKSIYYFSLFICVAAFILSRKYIKNPIMYQLRVLLFVSVIVVVTMKVSINNKILQYFGYNLFGLYILQRIPMVLFKDWGVEKYNNYLYFILCFIGMVLISIPFNILTKKIRVEKFIKVK